ncbi:acyltransferase family protein [Novosphingobium sp. JCM 18896]|uniref:acyltransferase family protein n=1 Tax=Novosphingobium sp. JCM 18896 TaxID=2989731 RepID=UPI002221B104|nr:acyltransferase family protein [Novosphingobium sp. JCM 18896]MCW1431810.1 acyltransferase [Novosphingobium sp. JCM 18896]
MPDPARHVASITGLRAIAVLAVILYHLDPAWMPGGFVGVDCFFVISGFVVAHSVIGKPANNALAFVAGFYRRRFLRLYPALLVYIVVATTASMLLIPLVAATAEFEKFGAAAALGLSPFLLRDTGFDYFAIASEFNPFAHTWSLGVEEQYYVLFSLFAYPLLIGGGARVRRGLCVLLGAAGLASLVYSARMTASDPVFAFYMLPTRFWELALGLGLRLAIEHPQVTAWAATRARFGEIGAAAGLGALVLACWSTALVGFPYPGALLPCLATAVLIAALWLWRDSGVARRLQSPMPLWIGLASYSLYLWHWGVIVFMRWTVGVDTLALKLIALAATFAIGAVSYHGIERAGRLRAVAAVSSSSFFLRFAGIVSLVVSACVWAVAFKPEVSLAAASQLETWNPYSAPAEPRPCVARQEVRLEGGVEARTFVAPCRKPGAPRLFVLGDSHASAYSRMLWRVAETGDWEVWLYSLQGCGVVNFRVAQRFERCERFSEAALADIGRRARIGDFVFLPALQTERFRNNWGDPEQPIYSDRGIDSAIFAANRARLARVAAMGHPVIVEGPKPLMPIALFRCADWFNREQTYCRTGNAVAKDRMRARMEVPDEGLRRIVAGLPGVSIWEPAGLLCPGARCDGYDRGLPLFVDVDHLSAHGNDVLFPGFLSALDRAQAAARSTLGRNRQSIPSAGIKATH